MTVIAGAGVAQAATHVRCGSQLTGYGYLVADLHCKTGITLTGNATLDLRGHTLYGPGASVTTGLGVKLSLNGNSVVENGQLRGWAHGIGTGGDTPEGQFNVGVSSVKIYGGGLDVWSATLKVSGSRFVDGDITGAYSFTTVTSSSFNNAGIRGWGGGKITLTYSYLNGTQKFAAVDCSEVSCDVEHNTIKNAKQNAIYGWLTALTVVDNTIATNGVGVLSEYTGGKDDIHANWFTGNGAGVKLEWLANSTIDNNTFKQNGTGISVPASDLYPTASISGNTLTQNTDGINAAAPPAGFTGPGLQGNQATYNTGWGIYAPGAVDLGGNIAYGNGNSPQCVGVTCSAS